VEEGETKVPLYYTGMLYEWEERERERGMGRL